MLHFMIEITYKAAQADVTAQMNAHVDFLKAEPPKAMFWPLAASLPVAEGL